MAEETSAMQAANDFIGSPVGSALGSVAGGILSNRSAKREAKKQRRFVLEMSNTAHQRETRDLLEAGLNPMLSLSHSGAPMGGAASAVPHDVGTPAVHSALESSLYKAQINQINQQAGLHSAEAAKVRAETPNSGGDGTIFGLNIGGWQLEKLYQETRAAAVAAGLPQVQIDKLREEIQSIKTSIDLQRVETLLRELDLPEAAAFAAKFGNNWGQYVSPYLRDVGAVTSAAGSALGAGAAAKYLFKSDAVNPRRNSRRR